MIDAGYNYPRLEEKMKWIDIDPASVGDILITHIDTDHVGALDFAFAHRDKVCKALRKQKPHDPSAPYDAYVEDDDTEQNARAGLLARAPQITK